MGVDWAARRIRKTGVKGRNHFVGVRIPAYTGSARTILLSTPRFVLFDLGIRHAASGAPGRYFFVRLRGRGQPRWARNRRSAARKSASSAQPRAAVSSASSDAAANTSVAVSNLADTSMPRDRRI